MAHIEKDMSRLTRRQFAGAAGLGGAFLSTRASGATRPPNIVLLLADDLGYHDLGCFGAPVARTPHLDRMAAEGVCFTNFFVSWPACTPSRGSILTGRYPQRNGLYEMIRNNEVNWGFQFDEKSYAISPEMTLGLDVREITLAQALRQAGYATGIVGKWDSGRARRFLPLQRGFDFYYGFANTGIDYYTHERYGVPSLFRGNARIQEPGHATDLFRREALRFIDEHRANPFFLYLAWNAPHMSSTFDKKAPKVPEEYQHIYREILGQEASKPFATMRRDEYLGLITHLDASIGAVFQRLKDYDLEDHTLVLFTSDNGGGDTGPLRGGKSTLFEGGLRVPMIARWPGRIPKGVTRDDLASTLEFFPTFLAAAGARAPDVKLDGYNLLPALEGKAPCPRQELFWEHTTGRAARYHQWKWIDSTKGRGLFDLARDLGESRDLSAERPAMRQDMETRWRAWKKEMDASKPRGPFRDY